MTPRHRSRPPTAEQITRMQERGALTAAEADALRTETDPQQVETVTTSIRTRHARARLAAGLADGSIDPEAAQALLDRIGVGEHSPQLRAAVNALAQPAGPRPQP